MIALVLITICCSFVASASAQTLPFPPTDTLRLRSEYLGDEREIWVQKPSSTPSEISSPRKLPVLLVLDADGHFDYAVRFSRYLHTPFEQNIPNMLVVGVRSTRRTAILTPKTGEQRFDTVKGRGEADAFLLFLEKELLPRMESGFGAGQMRVIFGHSLGGLFAVYAHARKPHLFRGIIAASPSVGYGGGFFYKKCLPAQIQGFTGVPATYLYISVGGKDLPNYATETAAFTRALDSLRPPRLVWEFEAFPTMTHWATAPATLYKGLYAMFAHPRISTLPEAIECEYQQREMLHKKVGLCSLPPIVQAERSSIMLKQNTRPFHLFTTLYAARPYHRFYEGFSHDTHGSRPRAGSFSHGSLDGRSPGSPNHNADTFCDALDNASLRPNVCAAFGRIGVVVVGAARGKQC